VLILVQHDNNSQLLGCHLFESWQVNMLYIRVYDTINVVNAAKGKRVLVVV